MLAFVGLEALYNFVRFHDVLETGLRFQAGSHDLTALLRKESHPTQSLYSAKCRIIAFSIWFTFPLGSMPSNNRPLRK